MTLGEKLKGIRKQYNLSQEGMAELLDVSRQAITKWENDTGLPSSEHLKKISQTFNVSIDYLLNDAGDMPVVTLRKQLDKNNYKNKLSSYAQILKENFPKPFEIYNLMRSKKMNALEVVLDVVTEANYSIMNDLSDLSPYYLVKRGEEKYLVNIKNWVLEVIRLEDSIHEKKFVVGSNCFVNIGKLML